MECRGDFSIVGWEEDTVSEKSGGAKLTRASVKQTYAGDMVGESSIEYIMAYETPTKASFVGFESFVGVINGLRGTVTFKHEGIFDTGVATSSFQAIMSASTGELSNKCISGTFSSGEAGKASYAISLTSP